MNLIKSFIRVSVFGRLFLIWVRMSKYIKSDVLYVTWFYQFSMFEKLNLSSPKSYTQKIQWLKLYRDDVPSNKYVDKYEVKQIVRSILGDSYVIPTIGIWDSFESIDFKQLPKRFVIKTTHDSGSCIVCDDVDKLNLDELSLLINRFLSIDYFMKSREITYKSIKPRIIAEPHLLDLINGPIIDYKFFCFHGVPKFLQISGFVDKTKVVNYYDMDFNYLNLTTGDKSDKNCFSKPSNFNQMKSIATRLSANFIHVRIDLYSNNDYIYFGEYTFHNSGGIVRFAPNSWNSVFGKLINIQ